MMILHAGMRQDSLHLWAETAKDHQIPNKKQNSGKPRRDRETLYYGFPTALIPTLSELLVAGPGAGRKKLRFEDLCAWLPTKSGQIVPSSPLIGDVPGGRGQVKLQPWRIGTCPLEWGQAVDFLCACSGKKVLHRGVVIGEDLAFWTEALRFSGSLVARQQYLPYVEAGGDDFRAIWRPICLGEDSDSLVQLAQRMPPPARALEAIDAREPPATPAIEMLKVFIGGAVDYLVRFSNGGALRPPAKTTKKRTFESVHDAWLYALRSSDNRIAGEKNELTGLAEKVRDWSRPITGAVSAPLRLCFRLEEPAVSVTPKKGRSKIAEESWYVRYLLQPKDDLSLLIQVRDAWENGSEATSALKMTGSELKEYLLTSLGQASAMCPTVASSLKTKRPSGYAVDLQGAYDFLSAKALLLRQSGFGVMLPAWWTGKGTKLQLSVSAGVKSPKMKAKGALSLDEVVRFDWKVAVGDAKITVEELEALAKLKAPLVKIRGQWVEIGPEQIQAAVDLWSKKGSEQATVRDVVKMALGAKEAPHGLRFDNVKASGWIDSLLGQLQNTGGLSELAPDSAFGGSLRPYQAKGLSWLAFLSQWGLGACLADDMGLGKTIQTLALIQRQWNANGKKPVLLVCPTTVVNNWQKEALRFTPDLPVMIHHGGARKKGSDFGKEVRKQAVVVSSYGLLHRDIRLFQGVEWSGIVLDEAQFIKNSETKQACAARSLKANYRVALTGTPVENNVGDLWSIMEFLNPGLLGSPTEFKRKFFVPIQAERDPAATELLKRITGPFILRRLKTDRSIIADLPDKLEMKVFCPLTKEQASLYAAVVKETEDALKSSEGIQRKGLILATLSKLKQVCNHPAHFLGDNSAISGRSGKLTRLTEMLEEMLEIGDRALVFTQYAEMGKLLLKHVQETFGIEAIFLHGGASKTNRDRMVERFQAASGGPSIFILSLKAGGTGLNLTSANHVFHFDRWWNPAVENQATDRAFRIGQTKNVQVRKFVTAGTLEEKIDEMIEQKKDVAEKVIGTGEGWITELSNKELKELWTLRKETSGE